MNDVTSVERVTQRTSNPMTEGDGMFYKDAGIWLLSQYPEATAAAFVVTSDGTIRIAHVYKKDEPLKHLANVISGTSSQQRCVEAKMDWPAV